MCPGLPEIRTLSPPSNCRALSLPVKRWHLRLSPSLLLVEESKDGNLACRLRPIVAKKLDLPADAIFHLRTDQKGNPSGLGYQHEDVDVFVSINDLSITKNPNESAKGDQFWNVPRIDGVEKPERVALSHFARFSEVALTNLDAKIETLPPSTGEKKVGCHLMEKVGLNFTTRLKCFVSQAEHPKKWDGNTANS